MGLLEKISSMKQGGMSDLQIINTLKDDGLSPMKINEAFSQLKIKSAVANNETEESNSELQPSIMQTQNQEIMSVPTPLTNQNPQGQNQTPQQPLVQQYTQEGYPDNQQYAQGQYADPNYYQQGLDLETVKDIVKQEIEESNKKLKAEVDSLSKLKTELKFEIQSLDNRFTKLESTIQEIQLAIIRKIGQYGEAIQGLGKEVKETQKSFSKVINPLVDQQRENNAESDEELNQESEEIETHTVKHKIKKKAKPNHKAKSRQAPKEKDHRKHGASFEDYIGR